MEEMKAAEILRLVDIIDAIAYYGITELLDTIGEEKIRLHLNQLRMQPKYFIVENK